MAKPKSGNAREFHLSVRLNDLEASRLLRMFEYYGLHIEGDSTFTIRFRELLKDFCTGLNQVEGIESEADIRDREDIAELFKAPPHWRQKVRRSLISV